MSITQEEFIRKAFFQEGAPDSFNSDYEKIRQNFQLKNAALVLSQSRRNRYPDQSRITTEKIETRVKHILSIRKYKNNTKILNKVVKTLTKCQGNSG